MKNTETMNKISQRICKIRAHFCENKNSKFAEKLGISQTQASNLCGGSVAVGDKSIYKILLAFPEVSEVWLRSGEGTMLRTIEFPSQTISTNSGIASIGNGNTNTISSNMTELYEARLQDKDVIISELRHRIELQDRLIEEQKTFISHILSTSAEQSSVLSPFIISKEDNNKQ